MLFFYFFDLIINLTEIENRVKQRLIHAQVCWLLYKISGHECNSFDLTTSSGFGSKNGKDNPAFQPRRTLVTLAIQQSVLSFFVCSDILYPTPPFFTPS